MTHINPYYTRLKTSYLFYRINQTVDALRRDHPQERLLLLGVGDVTLPLAPAVIAALHRAAEDQAKQESFQGYMPELGKDFMKQAVADFYARRGTKLDPAEIFARAAAIGRRRLTYWNIDEKLHMGGTSYLLLRPYVAACLREFGITGARLTWRLQAKPEQMARELERGRLLILAMTRHGCYGSHLVMAWGTVRVAVEGRGAPRLYLLLSDGWSSRPRYVAADTLKLCGYVAVEA
jgi:hypothetical protein